ncbi:MAG TPA: carboxypeptidase-like regulatory domain-containing protein [Pyrinomonadaceae bacterium]|jgi:hypothetical protein|nr:carboxypeptidase-like regulatory domain-containing protein [Pyrinomonadaceae bacterium]
MCNLSGAPRRLFLSAAILAVLSPFVYAQRNGSVAGEVRRRGDNSPIYNAKVTVRETGSTARTGSDGKYRFDSLPANKDYTLLVEKDPLYEPGQTTVSVKPKAPSKAETVRLARVDTNARIKEVFALFERRQYEKFKDRLNSLKAACEGEKDKDCRLVREISDTFNRKDYEATRKKLNELQAVGAGRAGRAM